MDPKSFPDLQPLSIRALQKANIGFAIIAHLCAEQSKNAMTLGDPTRLTCPYCGKAKHILSIASGNTFGAIQWSDTKNDYPMLRFPSTVQRCPHCGGYYFYDDSNPVECDPEALSEKQSILDWNSYWPGDAGNATICEKKDRRRQWERWKEANANGFGDLSFEEMDAAFSLLYPEFESKRQQTLLFMWLFSYNDTYGGRQEGPAPECPQGILERHRFVADELLRRFEGASLLLAELHREMGEFEECIRIAGESSLEAAPGLAKIVSQQIIEHAKAGETDVFPLVFPQSRPDWIDDVP